MNQYTLSKLFLSFLVAFGILGGVQKLTAQAVHLKTAKNNFSADATEARPLLFCARKRKPPRPSLRLSSGSPERQPRPDGRRAVTSTSSNLHTAATSPCRRCFPRVAKKFRTFFSRNSGGWDGIPSFGRPSARSNRSFRTFEAAGACQHRRKSFIYIPFI